MSPDESGGDGTESAYLDQGARCHDAAPQDGAVEARLSMTASSESMNECWHSAIHVDSDQASLELPPRLQTCPEDIITSATSRSGAQSTEFTDLSERAVACDTKARSMEGNCSACRHECRGIDSLWRFARDLHHRFEVMEAHLEMRFAASVDGPLLNQDYVACLFARADERLQSYCARLYEEQAAAIARKLESLALESGRDDDLQKEVEASRTDLRHQAQRLAAVERCLGIERAAVWAPFHPDCRGKSATEESPEKDGFNRASDIRCVPVLRRLDERLRGLEVRINGLLATDSQQSVGRCTPKSPRGVAGSMAASEAEDWKPGSQTHSVTDARTVWSSLHELQAQLQGFVSKVSQLKSNRRNGQFGANLTAVQRSLSAPTFDRCANAVRCGQALHQNSTDRATCHLHAQGSAPAPAVSSTGVATPGDFGTSMQRGRRLVASSLSPPPPSCGRGHHPIGTHAPLTLSVPSAGVCGVPGMALSGRPFVPVPVQHQAHPPDMGPGKSLSPPQLRRGGGAFPRIWPQRLVQG
mmetsp:Transcript_101281/g.285545  ORF Transcript_101281/g.285545 Transcript_101281/m.285545 type:complete len:528 (-) Transcript_101281:82-1665(-)